MSRRAASCPDWVALVAVRDGEALPAVAAGVEPSERRWRDALAHLAGCPRCRPQALAEDPTLLFQALPRIETTAGDVTAMRQAVTAMRRARRVAPEPRPGRLAHAAARVSRIGRWGGGLAAAALLAVASGGLWMGLPRPDLEISPVERPAAGDAAVRTIPFGGSVVPSGRILPSAGEPVFMDLSSPRAADVYRLGRGGGLQVVMVVDETLDV